MLMGTLTVGPLETNCYIVAPDRKSAALIVDPGAEPERILHAIKLHGLKPIYIVNTHGHSDHIQGNRVIKERTGARILVHEEDAGLLIEHRGREASPPANLLLRDGSIIEYNSCQFRAIHTPGHTKGSICLLTEGFLFTGDTLFAGGVGRTDPPLGSHRALITSIRTKLLSLDGLTLVLPGHGRSSTIGYERRNNPFLKRYISLT